MSAAQYGNKMLQKAVPWQYLVDKVDGDDSYTGERANSLAKLAYGWRLARFLAITSHPFLPFSAQRLWAMLGQSGDVSEVPYASATDWKTPITWSNISEPLFSRLDLETIIEHEESLALSDQDSAHEDPGHGVKGSGKKMKEEEEQEMNKAPEGTEFLNFDTFMSVELRTGTITSVEDHPNADKLYVIQIDDGTESGRTVCAGLKPYYKTDEMMGKQIVFVANLEPRKLRGVMSEGMICAADDGNDSVKLITIDGVMQNGSRVR
jgi:methionyl-tRNA synthetase